MTLFAGTQFDGLISWLVVILSNAFELFCVAAAYFG